MGAVELEGRREADHKRKNDGFLSSFQLSVFARGKQEFLSFSFCFFLPRLRIDVGCFSRRSPCTRNHARSLL